MKRLRQAYDKMMQEADALEEACEPFRGNGKNRVALVGHGLIGADAAIPEVENGDAQDPEAAS